jgi:flagellar motor switch protein FliN/FliY
MSTATTTITLQTAAAAAVVQLLPTATVMDATVVTDKRAMTGQVDQAVTAVFVGAMSADVALVLHDTDSLAAAAGNDSLVSHVDVMRPAIEAAVAVLGAGVLGDSITEDASSLFADADTVVFELSESGKPAGWFAMRVHTQHGKGTAAATQLPVGKLSRIRNVEMELTVVIGKTRMTVQNALDLEPGSVVELDRSAGAPADILLNGRLIAHGEVVVVDQDYAVRVTNIIDLAEGLS